MRQLPRKVSDLAAALTKARQAVEAVPVQDMGGSGNLDWPEVRLPVWQAKAVSTAAEIAGLRCSKEQRGWWRFGGWEEWQGSNRTIKAEQFAKVMRESGFNARIQYMMD